MYIYTRYIKTASIVWRINPTIMVGTTKDLDANSFAVIADLIDGDKAKEAKELAVSMKDRSSECMSLSMQMVDSLEKSVDALPDVIEKYIEKKAQQSVTNDLSIEERDMINSGGIDKDVGELQRCVDAIENLNLLTAIESGKYAFTAIKEKSTLCHTIFEVIKKFASDISSIATAVSNMDASTVLEKVKDGSILKAIGLSKFIKQLAEEFASCEKALLGPPGSKGTCKLMLFIIIPCII